MTHKVPLWLWLLMPLLTAAGQVCFKLTAGMLVDQPIGIAWVTAVLTAPWMLLGLGFDIAIFFVWTHILAKTDVGAAVPISALSYIAVIATSVLWFKEPFQYLHLLGGSLILTGVWMVSIDNKKNTP